MVPLATNQQIQALMKAHFADDAERFKVISLQIAAHESKVGHTTVAQEIKKLVENAPHDKKNIIKFNQNNESMEMQYVHHGMNELVVSNDLEERIKRVLFEYKKRNLLLKNGLKNRSKLLFEGPPGTGKTLTASVIATELSLPLYSIQLDGLLSKFMGETSSKLKKVFQQINEQRGVYLFDEFDAIGADRNFDNDVGEMRRILNSFLQYIERDKSSSIIIAATNNPKMLDKALFRRFDDVLEYRLPDKQQIKDIFRLNLKINNPEKVITDNVLKLALDLNHAELVMVSQETLKYSLLNETTIDESQLLTFLKERKNLVKYEEA